MQYQKEEVRNKIITAAIEEFEKKGYQRANILNIALNAHVPIGNLYRYFKGKADLFSAVVKDAYDNIRPSIQEIYESEIKAETDQKTAIMKIASKILHIFVTWTRELLILVDKSVGSVYQDFYPSLVGYITSLFESGLFPKSDASTKLLCSAIAEGLTNGLFAIIRTAKDDEEMYSLIEKLIFYYTYNIDERVWRIE